MLTNLITETVKRDEILARAKVCLDLSLLELTISCCVVTCYPFLNYEMLVVTRLLLNKIVCLLSAKHVAKHGLDSNWQIL